MTWQEELQSILPPHQILLKLSERIPYASDASLYRIMPQAVVRPRSLVEVQKLFALSHAYQIPLTFRAAGTSLSGQALGEGIVVDLSKGWRDLSVLNGGESVRAAPGVIGQHINNRLRSYGRKIGPDPASISACMIGGIVANNASGMCCGVTHNAYHTVQSMRFILPHGCCIDGGSRSAEAQFNEEAADIAKGLQDIRRRILANAPLQEKIRAKYQIKNTMGYSLNAFLDFEKSVDIMQHLLVGSEGTLGFIGEVTLATLPDLPYKYTGLLCFESVSAAANAIAPLKASGAAALEIMDRAAIASIELQEGAPEYLRSLPPGAAVLLVEYHSAEFEGTVAAFHEVKRLGGVLPLITKPDFTDEDERQHALWKVRKGMFPAVGATKPKGATVIIEDVAFPVERLGEAVTELQALFRRHGYDNAIIFGHAKEGNLHFVITPTLNDERSLHHYRDFMRALATLVVDQFGGALKAEHGTGRNMAPFVEHEWGKEAYEIMCEVKRLIDPHNLLNPGVVINTDRDVFIKNIKELPEVEEEVDKCIECGFCEPKCPSRDLTLTPRQRIVVRRELKRMEASGAKRSLINEVRDSYRYQGLATCAVDGLCQTACPVGIDTGKLVKRLRGEESWSLQRGVALFIANHMPLIERLVRMGLSIGSGIERIVGTKQLQSVTHLLSKILPFRIPQWGEFIPRPLRKSIPSNIPENPEYLYLPSCLSRVFGDERMKSATRTVPEILATLAARAKIPLKIAPSEGTCCGTPFSSKGYHDAYNLVFENFINTCFKHSQEGKLPIVLDTTPCTYNVKTTSVSALSPQTKERYAALRFLDSVEFISEVLLPRLKPRALETSVTIHPVCSLEKLNLTDTLRTLMRQCATRVEVPLNAGCCGFAGDRGLLVPELTESATKEEAKEVRAGLYERHCSSCKTCEIALSRGVGKQYQSYLHIVEEATR